MEYIKHFNQQTVNYLRFRPDYPDILYNFLTSLPKDKHCAWDCGTGNGQAALDLSKHFIQVIATDVNQAPLESAPKRQNIHYLCCSAEKAPIADQSIDLITIAQALHWFNFDLFYSEAKRVMKQSAWIAAWCYSLGQFNSNLDKPINKLYRKILGDRYWPAERHYIDDGYRTIPFPFLPIEAPTFFIEKEINFHELIGYLNTWSAVKEYELQNKRNPINLVAEELASFWGEPTTKHRISWPLHLLVGTL